MFNHGQAQNHNVFVNGGHGQSRFNVGVNKGFQQNSQHHQGHAHRQQQDSIGQAHHGFPQHQQNSSSSAFPVGTPQYAPGHMRNGTPTHIQNGPGRPQTEHMAQQQLLAQQAREMQGHHYYARTFNQNKVTTTSAAENIKRDSDREQRQRSITLSDESSHQQWSAIDLGGQGLKAISPPLFDYRFLTKVYLNNNRLAFLPAGIGRLRNLTHLDLSLNELHDLPPEIGMLVNLKELRLIDNHLMELPIEMGYLYQLEVLGLEGNPLEHLDERLANIFVNEGPRAMITEMRETAEAPPPPNDRQVIDLDGSLNSASSPDADTFSVLSYNTLCERGATQNLYGYLPLRALQWENRRELIVSELEARDPDIMCMQEIDTENYHEFFRPKLAHKDYKGVFFPRARARTMTDKEARSVDGCATFYRNSKYVLLDKQYIDFANTAINRPDMRGEHDVFNRVMPRDHIAVVTFLEERHTGSRLIVVNVHVFWDHVYKDVKVVQVAIMLEQLSRIADTYAKHPPLTEKDKARYRFGDADAVDEAGEATAAPAPREPGPSQSYSSGTQIPMLICGDFNSLPGSGPHELISSGMLSPKHSDLEGHNYGLFTKDGMSHPFALKSAYGNVGELSFTNYTPTFLGVIDYIWYSYGSLSVSQLLGEVDDEYLQRMPGFPNWHFPSDHLALMAHFVVKGKKERRPFEADFGASGSQKDRGGTPTK